MGRTWNAVLFGAAAALAVGGCSSSPDDGGGRDGAAPTETHPRNETTGDILLYLTIPGGEEISALTYRLTNGTRQGLVTGTFVVPADAVSLSFEIPSIPAGGGYSLLLQTRTSDGKITCEGSDPVTLPVSDASPGFEVTSRSVTIVNLLMTCTIAVDGGAPPE